jgi:hypothetical protein
LLRARAVLLVAATWSGGGALVGTALQSWRLIRFHGWNIAAWPYELVRGVLLQNAVQWAIAGALGGVAFATLLSWMERHHTFRQLTSRRVAAWGVLGALALTGTFIAATRGISITPRLLVSALLLNGMIGGIGATMMLALARKGSSATDAHRAVSGFAPENGISAPDSLTDAPILDPREGAIRRAKLPR